MENAGVGVRQTAHSQEGQIILGSKVNWMKVCRRRINTESFVARVGGGTWDRDGGTHSREEGRREGDDQCSSSAPGSWRVCMWPESVCNTHQSSQIASGITERCEASERGFVGGGSTAEAWVSSKDVHHRKKFFLRPEGCDSLTLKVKKQCKNSEAL